MRTEPDLLFSSEEHFIRTFEEGLLRLLQDADMAAFILVCANALFDRDMYDRARKALVERFQVLERECCGSLRDGREPKAAPDDLLVFLKLMAVRLDHLARREIRHAGPWEVQFNPVRAFRPKRMSAARIDGIHKPFDRNGFHFNKPFLLKEAFWEGKIQGVDAMLFYNKFPFVEFHSLLVPKREKELPQYLTERHHRLVFDAVSQWGETLPGVGCGYNAYGANASINHLHFQMFLRRRPLPVTHPAWRHNGGGRDYPARCEVFDDAGEAWAFIDSLHRHECAYNLVYLPGRDACTACRAAPRAIIPIPPGPAAMPGTKWPAA
jgi:diadenosine tetraphosphate (Ap4A) HIT family hydrolase